MSLHHHSHHGSGGSDHNHFHANSADPRNEKRIAIAAVLTGGFMIIEAIGGWVSGSLALLADAAHMLTDSAALFLAWIGFRLGRRPANDRFTFGYDRVAILAAFTNGLTLFFIAGMIVWEAFERLSQPYTVMGWPMFAIAVTGLLVNLLVFWILLGADRDNLNIRGAVLHVMGDILGSIAAIAAALIIVFTGYVPADMILSVLVALLILKSAWGLMKQSAMILLEASPEQISRDTIIKALREKIDGLVEIDHMHIWSISQERPMMSINGMVGGDTNIEQTVTNIRAILHDEFGIEHVTIELCKSL